jgi:hypothetical protein
MGTFLNRGNAEFERAINSQIYVDKTEMITFFNQVINTEQAYICVSRPRRFGKTITANMIAAYFEKGCDSRSLFENRKLGQTPDWDRNLNKYDVIRIDFAGIQAQKGSGDEMLDYVENCLVKELREAYSLVQYDSELDKDLVDVLARINEQTGAQFVIVIDEWDALFRDNPKGTKIQQRYINLLRTLFKDNRSKKFTALAYITGILPIKKYNSESALNNFDEYTMISPGPLAGYVGFREEEVQVLCEQYHMDFEQLRDWYDGYNLEGCSHIFGPNSVVKALLRKRCENYWSQTVVYNSLTGYITMNYDGLKDSIKLLLGSQHVRVDTLSYANDMVSFHDRDSVLTVLIHLGYLAYDQEREEVYIPNKEVRQIFERAVKLSKWNEVMRAIEASEDLLEATLEGDEEAVAEAIDTCHMENTSILNYNNENALACVITLAYYTARKDYQIFRELPAGRGFADLVFLPKKHVDSPALVMELKWKKNVSTALDQIRDRQYPKSLETYCGEILLVGISYDKAEDHRGGSGHTCRIERYEKND